MILKFGCATFLALATSADAFLVPANLRAQQATRIVNKAGGSLENEDFLSALSGGNPGSNEPDSGDAEPQDGDQGGSRFKDILAQAQQAQDQPAFRPMKNPFIDPPAPAPADPAELSVEEQARMFREMMQNGGAVPPPAAANPQRRVSRTDSGGRPVGRNRDADTIANTADLYFAQLKRDSTVRGIARLHGDYEAAEKVFEDEGIKELDGMLQTNPYLKG